jgi:ADP-ribose pyrophosphatase YjhB (NUDIX family)
MEARRQARSARSEAEPSGAKLKRLAWLVPDYARNVFEGLLAPAVARSAPTVLAQAVVRQGGRVLLAVRDTLRGWELPGGAVQHGESLEDALRREVREETGLDVRVRRLVGVYARTGFRAHVAHVFECDVVGGNLRPSPETPELAWFGPSALPDTIFPWFRGPLLDALANAPAPVERCEHQGVRAILAGARIDLRMRMGKG